jgi:Na+-transporting methylmalonyl-CoA/oxaloacetate decarboxylase gamma subunit
MVNWLEALKVAGIGFGGVFTILVILMLSVTFVGAFIKRLAKSSEKSPDAKA